MRYSVKAQYSLDINTETKSKPAIVDVLTVRVVREGRQSVESRTIHSPGTAAAILSDYLEGADREHFVALLLDTKHRVIGIHTVSIGSVNETVVHPRETFKAAIILSAAAVLLAHCHPSGDTTPSPEDIACTCRLVEAGRILGIEVIDHIIIGNGWEYTSLKQTGRM